MVALTVNVLQRGVRLHEGLIDAFVQAESDVFKDVAYFLFGARFSWILR